MTAGYGLAGAPSSGLIRIAAPSVYREVVIMWYDCHSGSYQGAFEWLERSDAKVSRAVPRGLGASDGPWLPDVRHEVVQVAVVNAASSGTHGDAAIHNPVFCNRYSTRTCVTGNVGV